MPGDHMFLMLSSSFRLKSTTPWPSTFELASMTCLTRSRSRFVTGEAMIEPRYLLMAPTFGAMDIPLSFSTMMMSRLLCPALFIPS